MRIIGIHAGHNAGVLLAEEGRAVWMLSEEKFTNKKNQSGFPLKSIRYLASRGDLKGLEAVVLSSEFYLGDAVAGGEAPGIQAASTGPLRRLYDFAEYWTQSITGSKEPFRSVRNRLYSRVSTRIRGQMVPMLAKECGVPEDKIWFLDHHRTHCLTPVYFYGQENFKEPLLSVSLDGDGDRFSGKILEVPPGQPEQAKEVTAVSYDSSLGYFYSHVTRFLGMKPLEHEYKVMGLAAYPDEKYYQPLVEKFRRVIWLDEEALQIRSRFNLVLFDRLLKKEFVGERFDNLAAAAQRFLEDIVLGYIRAAIRKTGVPNVAFSGGVFMNVKMNHRIVQMPEVKRAFFMPSCGDDSLPVGALGTAATRLGQKLQPVQSMYLGLRYPNGEVGTFLEAYRGKYKITHQEDIEGAIAELLAKFQVVARFKGAGEWGARSLGNRAILANPSDFAMFHEVNDAIKMRDFWMPFAPTILDTWAEKYLADWDAMRTKSPESLAYMILASQATPLGRKHLRAAMHQKDGSIRPQIVRREDNAEYYRLIEKFCELTGIGGVLNTSMNLHGYPLVGTLEQAMFTFENSKMKHIAIENYLIEKTD